ncbi:MAG TPA: ASKHA domain-containing protein, partial [Gaiellales bacterium]|nr:ASKHA domain-containing protein [Gaiellales bacterium]
MSTPEPVEVGAGRVLVRFAPDGTETRVPVGTTIFDAASWNGVAIDSTCGGHGTCKKCKVRLASGSIPISAVDPRAFTVAELKDGWRLACRAPVTTDLDVEVPPLQTRPKAALVGVGRHVILRPAVQKRYVELSEPSLEDQASDLERLLTAISDLELRVHLGAARALGSMLRSSDFKVTAVVVDDELIDIEPGDTTETRHAIAFDLGTTTVVATLLDLTTGQPLAVRSMLNRQQPYGADVISRVSATMMDADALEALQARAAETLDMLAGEVCEQAGVAREQVYEISLCGNVTMTQLALGIDPEPLAVAPFIITARQLPAARAADFGVRVHPRAPAAVFPALGAYVGGDIVAGLLATGLTRDRRLRLFIDVGTNSEIALGSAERVLATAAPAGPAFEAAQIKCGMRAAEGAIEGVKVVDDDLQLEVIGNADPVGMCGSGLVDAVAALVGVGLIDHSGRFVPDETAAELHPGLATRLVKVGEERVFVLAWRGDDPANAVYLSQRDVRELQFAKASIATGWTI